MPKYVVVGIANMVHYSELVIEAKSLKEAKELAEELTEDDFESWEPMNFELDDFKVDEVCEQESSDE